MDVKLPFAVKNEEGQAKFDIKKKQMKIRISIDKEKLPVIIYKNQKEEI